MGAIVDVLLLDRADVTALKHRYPDSVLVNKTNTDHRIQEYHLVIQRSEDGEEGYFDFLLDHLIATSSRSFQARYAHDQPFRERMKARADDNLRRVKMTMSEPQRA